MKKNKKSVACSVNNTIHPSSIVNILISIRFYDSMNKFEEIYGDVYYYQKLEQESYLELKEIISEYFNRKVKFRKYIREGMTLCIRAELTEKEYKKLLEIYNDKNIFNFFSSFIISNIKPLGEEEVNELSKKQK